MFLGKTADAGTGLTHIGVRECDPTTATFLSVDPLLQTDKPQTLNGYSYGAQNPYTYADPTGTQIYDPVTGLGMGNSTVLHNYYHEHHWINKHGHYTSTFYHSTTYKSWHHESTWLAHHWHSLPSSNPSHVNHDSGKSSKDHAEKSSFWHSLSHRFHDAVDTWTNNLTSLDWWKHKGVDVGIGFVAAFGTAACIASVVCGAGLFVVGAGALFAAGLGAHMAIATPKERRRGAGQYIKETAKAEGKGIISGALCGRGPAGCFAFGPKAGFPLEGVARKQLLGESVRVVKGVLNDYMGVE